MTVEETLKELRHVIGVFEAFDTEEYKHNIAIQGTIKAMRHAVEVIDWLNDFEQSQCVKLLEKITELKNENERFKAENEWLRAGQPVTCEDCVHCIRYSADYQECGLTGIYTELSDYCVMGECEEENWNERNF